MDTQAPDSVSSLFQDPVRRARHQTRWFEWGLLSIALLCGVALLSVSRGLERIDLVINDQLTRLDSPGVSPDIVIVAIDDKSLTEIGLWPWRREVHAALLRNISAAAPRAVGLDLIFVEHGAVDAGDDRLLGDAMAHNGKVVVPLMLQDRQGDGRLTRTEPVPDIASQAAALGHVHLEIDPDGIVRSTFLREGDGTRWWDHFAVAVLRTGGFVLPHELPGLRAPSLASPADTGAWQRDHWVQIPFAGPAGSFDRISYVDVLKGRVPQERLAGKYVLVGATAAGMGDAYATPRSGAAELMPGVEIAANVMNGLLLDHRLQRASAWQNIGFCVLPVALALLTVVLLPPTAGLLASAGLLAATLSAAWLASSQMGLQFAPAAGLLGVLLAYPLWVWRRLRTAIGYLLAEFERMEARRDLPTMLPAARRGDVLDQHIHALQDASEQLRNLHRFVSETLNSVPDATLIADTAGYVLMANQAARRHFAARGVTSLRGRSLEELLREVLRADNRQPVFNAIDRLRPDQAPWGAEARDAEGRDLLIRFVPCFNTEGNTTSWIASLVDITPIREAERQRDVALRFISHDMRSPQSSILALLEVQRLNPQAPVQPETLERIERHSRRTLDLAEEFVQLARAESSSYRMETVDLTDLLDEAVDDVWPQAQARQVTLQVQRPDSPALCEADRGLLTRAIANLLVNAVKYGHENADVHCAVQRTDRGWRVSITDQGPGLQPEEQQTLFQQFARLEPNQGIVRGVGLGLVFVRTVVERHGGRVEVFSQPGKGTTFHFTLASVTS